MKEGVRGRGTHGAQDATGGLEPEDVNLSFSFKIQLLVLYIGKGCF